MAYRVMNQKHVEQLSPKQRELVASLAKQLGAVRGIKAVVLAGSYAPGRGQTCVDFIYLSLEHVERVIAEAELGRYEVITNNSPHLGS